MIANAWKVPAESNEITQELPCKVKKPRKWSKQDLEIASWDHKGQEATLELWINDHRYQLILKRDELTHLNKQIEEVLKIQGEAK